MKKEFTAIFFYLLYLLAMMRPLQPVIEYYANQDYISSVLCENRNRPALACHGKCYLQKQLSKASSSEHDQHSNHLPKIDLSKYPVSLITIESFYKENKIDYSEKIWNPTVEIPCQRISDIFRPPISSFTS